MNKWDDRIRTQTSSYIMQYSTNGVKLTRKIIELLINVILKMSINVK
jgi:hypothetical protein